MGGLFDIEGPVVSFFERLADLVILNLIFMICCLPVITIGASVTALSAITQKMSRKEEGYIVRGFFRAFKENFLQATAIWLILMVLSSVWVVDMRFLGNLGGGIQMAFLCLLFILGFLCFFEFIYAFPLLAKFNNTTINTMKNALLLALRYLPRTGVLILLNVLPLLAGYMFLQFGIPFYLIMGFSVISLACSHVLKKIFDPLIKEGEENGG
ncbi:MAG: YesL family protein [Lachnospiraceae bacterium]|nr:YesL family protein [Lachnospiraceae bacterium]